MNMSFNPEENQVFGTDVDVLSVFKKKESKKEIQQGMSPKAIAEIVSDHLMEVVRKQFEDRSAQAHKK